MNKSDNVRLLRDDSGHIFVEVSDEKNKSINVEK